MKEKQENADITQYSMFDRYLDKIEKRSGRASIGFKTHFFSFLSVNAFLFILWILTGAGHPWFFYPLGAWGIGIAHHFVAYRNTISAKKAAKKISRLSEKGLRLFKRLMFLKSAFRQHTTAVVSVSAYLCMINTITGVGFQWWLFPAAALGLGLSIHSIPNKASVRSTEEKLHLEMSGESMDSVPASGIVREAKHLETHIRKELEAAGSDIDSIGGEILPLLENYIKGIQELNVKKQEIQEVLMAHPKDRIRQERIEIEAKMNESSAPALQKEYSKALAGLSRHEESVLKLEERRELIDLRLQSSIQSLRQLQLDLARLKTSELSTMLERTALDELKIKSREMTAYIEDFDSGYEGLE